MLRERACLPMISIVNFSMHAVAATDDWMILISAVVVDLRAYVLVMYGLVNNSIGSTPMIALEALLNRLDSTA